MSTNFPTQPAPFIPGAFATIRGNVFSVNVAGGGFVLSISEIRSVAAQNGSIVLANVEVGRFAIDPVSMVHLHRNLDQAVTSYEAIFGVLPVPESILQKFKTEAATEDLERQLRSQNPSSPPLTD